MVRMMSNIDVTSIVQALLTLMGAVITAVLIPYIRSKTSVHQQEEISGWVRIAVMAAEQIYNGSGRGPEKKDYVIKWLNEHGISVDESKIDTLIEAAVYKLESGDLFGEKT